MLIKLETKKGFLLHFQATQSSKYITLFNATIMYMHQDNEGIYNLIKPPQK